jgi:multiple sugar transport system substrate-binding protein
MPRTRREVLGAWLVPAVATAATACGAPAPGAGPAASSVGPATLRYTTEPGRVDSGVKDVVDAFNAKGGPIQVELEPVPGNFPEKMVALAAAGSPPDVMHSHPRDYHPYVNSGMLVGLDAYLKKERQNAPDLLPAALDYWNRDGQHWAVPYNLSVQNLFFNKDLFDKQGLKTPDQWEKDGKWTHEAYLDLAHTLTSGAGEAKVYGAVWIQQNLDIQLGFIWPFGGDLWDKDQKKTVLDSKEALEAIQFQGDLTAKYGASPTDDEWKQYAPAPSASWGAAFSAGRAAMEIQPNDSLQPHVVPAPFAKGVVPLPKGRAGGVVRGLAVGVHLLKGSAHQDAAWEFATFHSHKDAEQLMLAKHTTLPWHRSTIDTIEKSMPLLPWENGAAYAEGLRRLRPTPYVSKFSDINSIYAPAYNAVRHGQKTAVQMVAEIKPQIEDQLRG